MEHHTTIRSMKKMNIIIVSFKSRLHRHLAHLRHTPYQILILIKNCIRKLSSLSMMKMMLTTNFQDYHEKIPNPTLMVNYLLPIYLNFICRLFPGLSAGGGERRSRKNSLSNYSVSNYSVLLNEFCCASSDKIDQMADVDKSYKRKGGFANTVATFFSSKKKEDEQPPAVTPTRKVFRSRSASEASLERTATM